MDSNGGLELGWENLLLKWKELSVLQSWAHWSSHRAEDNSEAAKTAGLFLQSQGFVTPLTSYKHQRLLLLCFLSQSLLFSFFFPPSNSYLLSSVSCHRMQSNYNKLGTKTNESSFLVDCSLTCTELRWPLPPGCLSPQPHAQADTEKLCMIKKILRC